MEDIQLLSLLEKNARYETQDLADILMESNDNIIKQMKTYEKDRIICGYHTIINWDKTNQDRVIALIEVGVHPERDYGYDRIAHNIAQYSEVDTMYLMSGKSEFLVKIHGKTMQEVADFVGSKLATAQHVTSTTTFFVLKQYKINGVFIAPDEKQEERLLITP